MYLLCIYYVYFNLSRFSLRRNIGLFSERQSDLNRPRKSLYAKLLSSIAERDIN